MITFIYKITNLVNGKIYIGQTKNSLTVRLRKHFSQRNCKNKCSAIVKAMQKYGFENFKIEPIIQGEFSKDELNRLEVFYIKEYNSMSPNGYNLQTGGNSFNVSDQVKDIMREKFKGRKILWADKISETMKKKWSNEDYRKQMSDIHKGKRGPYKKHSKPLRIVLDDDQIFQLFDEGLSINKISKVLGVSFCTIKRRLLNKK